MTPDEPPTRRLGTGVLDVFVPRLLGATTSSKWSMELRRQRAIKAAKTTERTFETIGRGSSCLGACYLILERVESSDVMGAEIARGWGGGGGPFRGEGREGQITQRAEEVRGAGSASDKSIGV
jgi:hypothetical protein